MKKWYAYSNEDLFTALSSSAKGLAKIEVENRLKTYGENILPSGPPPSLAKIFLQQFKNPLIYILLVAGIVSLLLWEYIDAVFIFIVLMINAVIGTYQEWNAAKSANALQQIIPRAAIVLRDGHKVTVNIEEIVPGDVVVLEPGLRIPADMRIIVTNSLAIDESLLTGESIPINKELKPLPGETIPLGDQKNMAFASTVVMRGSGLGMVTDTGDKTEIGKIAVSIFAPSEVKTPLLHRMEVFTKNVAVAILGAIVILALLALARGFDQKEIFFMAVALAVSAIPEGLPVGVTITLANGMNRMTRISVIVRNLVAVEGLGSCTVIASDKTGTLTHNQLTVKQLVLPTGQALAVSGEGYAPNGSISAEGDVSLVYPLIKTSVLCNEGTLYQEEDQWHHQGDSVDVALLVLGEKWGASLAELEKEHPKVSIIPFDADYRYAATMNQEGDNRHSIHVKGAVEALLARCTQMQTGDALEVIEPDRIEQQALALARDGYRVLAFASKEMAVGEQSDNPGSLSHEDLEGLTFLGLVGMIDPLRQEAIGAVKESTGAGVKVCMVTGDHPVTALTIAKELGIATSEEQVVTGVQLGEWEQTLPQEEFNRRIGEKTVFARVEPIQKKTIVQGLMALGNFVAVTGDGVNDAPALKEANIGVAMGSGTDVAKEAADIVITDDNFTSIVAGIREGRVAYNNIRKVIYLLVSMGAAEVMLFVLAVVFGYPLPLLAAQILWLNLVTNGVQHVALAFEPAEGDEMKQRPRSPQESVFNPIMVRQIAVAGLYIGLIGFVGWVVFIDVFNFSEYTARNLILLLMVFFENFHVLNCRSEAKSLFTMSFFNNKLLIWAIVIAQAIHIAATHIPIMQVVLSVEPVTMREWLITMVIGSTILIAMEIFKFFERKRRIN
ncbi:MAG: HAD-IC family P-type ATPase [Clostridia bacterium]|jgi:calcium-translocating P-type ATPase|nr:HAD-IC family P-type ATPase [Clostridia bacterium]